MKNALILAVVASAAMAVPAFAQEGGSNNDSATITVNGSTSAKCNIAGTDTTVQLGSYDLTNDQGRARNNVGSRVANALTALDMHAWCTGGQNRVVLSRTSLQATSSANGGLTETGFAQNIIYDVVLKIDGLTRTDRTDDLIEATEDGTNGPVVNRFGPTGQGAKLSFATFGTESSATSVGGTATLSRDDYTATNARLVAGNYQGTVTLTLEPGV